ncbi:MAG: hypothetical protein DRN15_10590 [Thermoprotei archaeon]|nr:MAG: hypothetical protein DRN15_10590 [Thermoprotei archaeon]RLF22313.1 MAG: hypothetical protein DRM97_05775 [Thermoprotei archaeon]
MRRYWTILAFIFIVLGISTLVPAPASKPCLLGYYAHCSLTPISTIICWILAGLCYWLGRRK